MRNDLVTGERGVEECLSLDQKSKRCLLEGRFNLQKRISNSPKLLKLICEDQVGTVGTCAVVEHTESYAKTTVNHLEKLDMKDEHRVLCLNWNCVTDEFIFKFEALLRLSEDLELTRRNLLKVTSSFFDPLGVLSLILVEMKILFWSLCQDKFEWDAPPPEVVEQVASGLERGAASDSTEVCVCWIRGRCYVVYYSWLWGGF